VPFSRDVATILVIDNDEAESNSSTALGPHGRALWTIIEQLLADRFAGSPRIDVSPDDVERYVGRQPAWEEQGTEDVIATLLDGARHPLDFNWRVERDGAHLRFTWKTRAPILPPVA
jgi:hypothetical protein